MTDGRTHLTRGRMAAVLAGTAVLAAACIAAGLAWGSDKGPEAISGALAGDPFDRATMAYRVRHVAAAALVGAALSAAGAAFQGLLRNSLAEPFLLGVSGGGGFAAVLVLLGLPVALPPLLGFGAVTTAAFAGATATIAAVYLLARRRGRAPTGHLLLVGVVANTVFSAATLVLTSLADPDQLMRVTRFLRGDLGRPPAAELALAGGAALLGTLVLWSRSRDLNALSFGEEAAAEAGVAVERVKAQVFTAAGLMTGAAVAIGGLVAFVGLIVPHICRGLVGPDHRLLVPVSALGGAAFLAACDLGVRLLTRSLHTQLPVGVVTAVLGGVFFLVVLARRPRDLAL